MAALPGLRGDWFVQSRFGLFIHWGLYALAARHEWVKSNERLTDAIYQRYFDHFLPDLFDPRAWARAARAAGMRYCVITAKHHEGFCLWDSVHTDYKSTRTPWGKDLLHPIVDAFRSEGLHVGLYYSLIDWHHPDFTIDRLHPQRDNPEARETGRQCLIGRYAEYARNQVRELLTSFGKIDILWLDFSYPGHDGKGRDDWQSEQLHAMVRELQPEILINDRLDLPGSEDFVTPEQYQPNAWPHDEAGRRQVWEACQTLSGSWGYHRDELTWKTVKQILWMLVDTVSKGGNMLLNVGPTARGEFDRRARDRLDGVARWMHHHGAAIHGCTASSFLPPPDCRYTQNGPRLYLHFMEWPFRRVHLPGLAGKAEYAQFLHDGSEIGFSDDSGPAGDALVLELPTVKPDADIPVAEIFLKQH